MLTKFRAAGLIWPALLSLPALALLVGLGNWQMSRKVWKEALIGRIEAGLHSAPVALDAVLGACLGAKACPIPEYARVLVRGTFEHENERYYYAPDPNLGPGVHVYTPLVLVDGRRVMINRGFVPDQLRAPQSRPAGQPGGVVEIVGLLRGPGDKAMFTPANDPKRNAWYWRDFDAMMDCPAQAGTGLAGADGGDRCSSLLRAFIDAEAEPANPGGWPRGGATNLQIANRHLEYALTWYGLAAALVGMFGVFAWTRLKAADNSASVQ